MNISDVNNDGIGLDGFDPVAYFKGNPLRGDRQYSFMLADVTYHFSSEENLEIFQQDPAKYIPIAGGYPTRTSSQVPHVEQDEKGFIGDKVFDSRRNLEDTPVSMENNVPNDIKEDGDIEMQNLSDSDN